MSSGDVRIRTQKLPRGFCLLAGSKPLVRKPASLSFAEAASLPFGGMAALHFLDKAGVRAGESVLVVGASGAVGSAMVQLARHRGAQVTAVCSAASAGLAQSLDAHAVIDYARQDFTLAARQWDVIADTVGASTFAACVPRLNEHGRYLSVAGGLMDVLACTYPFADLPAAHAHVETGRKRGAVVVAW